MLGGGGPKPGKMTMVARPKQEKEKLGSLEAVQPWSSRTPRPCRNECQCQVAYMLWNTVLLMLFSLQSTPPQQQ